ncbi:MAG: hypothetical protein EBU90_04400 [Proteobacteria bacterium]|nr:hypothetical protein [Pseudomonadota bacterium]
MLEELPTVFLSIGSYNQRYRKDYTFGITFLLTRILFHAFLIYKTYQNGSLLVSGLALLVLTLHTYWFYGWLKKYYWKTQNRKTTETTPKQPKAKQH